jgi:hypothetical protein
LRLKKVGCRRFLGCDSSSLCRRKVHRDHSRSSYFSHDADPAARRRRRESPPTTREGHVISATRMNEGVTERNHSADCRRRVRRQDPARLAPDTQPHWRGGDAGHRTVGAVSTP